jgi:hypothetical protein
VVGWAETATPSQPTARQVAAPPRNAFFIGLPSLSAMEGLIEVDPGFALHDHRACSFIPSGSGSAQARVESSARAPPSNSTAQLGPSSWDSSVGAECLNHFETISSRVRFPSVADTAHHLLVYRKHISRACAAVAVSRQAPAFPWRKTLGFQEGVSLNPPFFIQRNSTTLVSL